jgi:putative ABC transport system permease protein
MPKTQLARKNLTHQPVRTLVSAGGIGFAILLMYMQLGFLGAVGDAATNVYGRMDCDLTVRSPEYLHVYEPRSVSDEAIPLLMAMPEAADVRTLDLAVADWRHPDTLASRAIAVTGLDLQRPALDLPEVNSQLFLLSRPDHVLMDRASRPDFGPVNGKSFGPQDVGRTTNATGKQVRIAGTFQMGTGLAANGAIFVSREGFRRISPVDHEGRASMILIKLREGVTEAAGRDAVLERLRSAGGTLARADVLTLGEAKMAERIRWYTETPIGMIFLIGVFLALIVGGIICYMVLAADVIANLPEYATLKAMGYSNRFLGRTVLAQSCYLASISLPPATLAALAVFFIVTTTSGIQIRMTWYWLVLVAVLSFLMCMSAGIVAIRKLSKAEPASLF